MPCARPSSLGLGLITFYLFLIPASPVCCCMFYYVPGTDKAYHIMKDLQFVVSAGLVLRNMHRWAAHLMVLFVMLHLCRVFYTGAYKSPREFNWVLGVGLFLVTLGLSLHRLSPALGPTGLLGHHGRHEHCRLCAPHW